MFTVIVDRASEVTDMDWIKRRAEAFGFNATKIGDSIVVTATNLTLISAPFMLCDLLNRNTPDLITWRVDDETKERYDRIEADVKSSHHLECEKAERDILANDPT